MQAYHNDQTIKENLINQLQAHYDADEIIKGVYWKDGKGCSIGCAIHSDDHKLYEEKFNIPEWMAILQDSIFEGLPNDKAKEWPILFSKSINLGSNLENIKIPFLIFVIESVIDKFNHDEFPDVKKAIDSVLHILKNNPNDKNAVRDVTRAAWAAVRAADSADSAAWAADSAAWAVRAAAWAAYAAWAADAAAADSAAWAAAAWAADAAAALAAAALAADAAAALAAAALAADAAALAVRADAADSAALAADAAWAAYAAAADSAADAAALAVRADSAVRAADSAALAADAAYEKFADKLIQLIVDCK
jgi:hypothetical protein